MAVQYSGRITYANGIAAQGVTVRIFDRDLPGQIDDDLTLASTVSDALGAFTIEYDAGRARDTRLVTRRAPANPPFDWHLVERTSLEADPDDDFQPYLEFSYTQDGVPTVSSAALKGAHAVYALPTALATPFLPSQHGFKFPNNFSGFFLPFALPALPGLTHPGAIYGLCGGMSAGVLDWWLANQAIPGNAQPPPNGDPLQRYLYKRQLDSLGPAASVIFRFVEWMGLPDDGPNGTQRRTLKEFEKIRTRLNRFTPVPIGLLYVKWADTNQVWQNHQVLATGYTRDDPARLRIQLYDPNHPLRDDVSIEAERVAVSADTYGLRVQQRIGGATKTLYGFFAMPYQAVIPPQDLAA